MWVFNFTESKEGMKDIIIEVIIEFMKSVQIFDGGMLRIAQKFNLHMLDIFFHSAIDGSTFSDRRLDNFHSYSAIFMCFLTNNVKSCFRVTFTPANSHDQQSSLEYSSFTPNRGGSGLHVFMWTEESRLFKEYSVHRDIWVSLLAEERIKRSNNVEEGRGWIVMVDKKTDVSQVCRELIMAST